MSKIVSVLDGINLSMSGAMHELSLLNTMGIDVQNFNLSAVGLMSNVAEITRTYAGSIANGMDWLRSGRIDAESIIHPPLLSTAAATSAIVYSTRKSLSRSEQNDRNLPDLDGVSGRLQKSLQAYGNHFSNMWSGAVSVLDSNSPDRVRQSAHSIRELLAQLLEALAPDQSFTDAEIQRYGVKGKVTRRMRIKNIIKANKSLSDWSDAACGFIIKTHDTVIGFSHVHGEPEINVESMRGVLVAAAGVMSVLISEAS